MVNPNYFFASEVLKIPNALARVLKLIRCRNYKCKGVLRFLKEMKSLPGRGYYGGKRTRRD